MSYVRVALMTPRRQSHHEATRLLAQILAHCSNQSGYRGGMLTAGGTGERRRVGRVTLWADRSSADRAATDQRMLALRAALDAIVQEDDRIELGLEGVDLSAEPGGEIGITPGEAVRIAEGLAAPRPGRPAA